MGMLENSAVKRRAFCMSKRVKYVTAHAQKFQISQSVYWYRGTCISLIRTFHLSKLFLALVQWGLDNQGCTVPPNTIINTLIINYSI